MSTDREKQAGTNTAGQSELIETLGAQELAEEVATLRELERQYSNRLCRMAQLCDTVTTYLLSHLSADELNKIPEEVEQGVIELTTYINEVCP